MESDSDEKASSSEPAVPISVSMGRSLPDDLLLTVLRKLPLESLLRFQCVCKKWNDLFMSREFSPSLCQKPGKLVPLSPGDGTLNLYDTSNRCWVQRDLNFGEDQGSFIEDQGYELVASGGGLLAFLAKPPLDSNWREQFPTFIVSNPLTRQYHRLPISIAHGSRSLNIPELRHMLCGIDVDLETGYYTFLFLDPSSTDGGAETYVYDNGAETYVYDSKLRSWRICSRMPSSVGMWIRFVVQPGPLFNRYRTQCVTKEGKFHWMMSVKEGDPLNLLYIYDVKLDVWAQVPVCVLPPWCMFFRCIEHKGQVLVVGFRGKSGKKLCFFEIVESRLEPRNPEMFDYTRLYLKEKKALPMHSVVDVLSALEQDRDKGTSGRKEVWIKWCVGARDEVIYLVQVRTEEFHENGVLDLLKSDVSRPMLRYAGVDNSWTWMSDWRRTKDDHEDFPPHILHPVWNFQPSLVRVWTFQPSLVSPGSMESKTNHSEVQ